MTEASSRIFAKRACDACKIRKVRCSNSVPCVGCVAIGTKCTFNSRQGTRGPRKLRAKTIQQITDSQTLPATEGWPKDITNHSSAIHKPETPLPPLLASVADRSPFQPALTPIATLVLHLCVYRLRIFPVWPIVAVEDLMAALQSSDVETYALANAIAAATILQLKLDPLKNSAETVTAESMEVEAQRARNIGHEKINLNTLRTVFFLHVYHENLQAGGFKALLYLRECITMAQIMGLDRESSYRGQSLQEQQFRKRVLWVLFVTERSTAMLHKLPIVLRSDISFPVMEYEEEVSILPAFRELVNLYWIFDKSEAFDLIQNSKYDVSIRSADQSELKFVQDKLISIQIDFSIINNVQAADISVTRAWMCVMLWKMKIPTTELPFYPPKTAKDFLQIISDLPTTAIEAHGPSIELKIYEIACSVVDYILQTPTTDTSTKNIVDQLVGILSSCRGGNISLVDQIKARLGETPSSLHPTDHFDLHTGIISKQQEVSEMIGNENRDANILLDSPSARRQSMLFSWELLNERQTSVTGTYDDDSSAFDKFLGDTISSSWASIRETPGPVSQWL